MSTKQHNVSVVETLKDHSGSLVMHTHRQISDQDPLLSKATHKGGQSDKHTILRDQSAEHQAIVSSQKMPS